MRLCHTSVMLHMMVAYLKFTVYCYCASLPEYGEASIKPCTYKYEKLSPSTFPVPSISYITGRGIIAIS
jgi:hypothetical protein